MLEVIILLLVITVIILSVCVWAMIETADKISWHDDEDT